MDKQEPVARVDYNERGNIAWFFGPQIPHGTLLYSTQPKREWVGLTDDELPDGETYEFHRGVRWAEVKLKEKNT